MILGQMTDEKGTTAWLLGVTMADMQKGLLTGQPVDMETDGLRLRVIFGSSDDALLAELKGTPK